MNIREIMSPLHTLLENVDSIQNLIYGMLLIVLIVYINLVPDSIRTTVDSAGGRVLGIGGLLLTLRYMGWIYALLYAVAFVLIVHGAPRIQEGFHSIQRKDVERPMSRWFVEQVLGEKPKRIETDTVSTEAVQDL